MLEEVLGDPGLRVDEVDALGVAGVGQGRQELLASSSRNAKEAGRLFGTMNERMVSRKDAQGRWLTNDAQGREQL